MIVVLVECSDYVSVCGINLVDTYRRTPYDVALKRKHGACAALLNPSSAAPFVWPPPLKFIAELNPEAKALLETALMDANREREKKILKGTPYSLPSPVHSDDGSDADDVSEVVHSSLLSLCIHIVYVIINFLISEKI